MGRLSYYLFFDRLHQRTGLRVKITVPLLMIVLLVSGAVGGIFYSQAKETIVSQVEARLKSETKKVTEKISLLKFALALDEKTYAKRFQFELRQQQSDLAQQGLTIEQFIVKHGSFQPIDRITIAPIAYSTDLAKLMEEKRTGVINIEEQGVIHTLAFSHSPEEQFIFVIDLPQSQYLAPLQKTLNFILITVVCSLFLSALISWFVVRSITAPLQNIIKVMEKVSQGNLNERLHHLKEGPEIRAISNSFNIMVEQMATIIKEIQQLIEELNRGGQQIDEASKQAGDVSYLLASRLDAINESIDQSAASTETASDVFQQMKHEMDQLFLRIQSVIHSSKQMEHVANNGKQQMDLLTTMIREYSHTHAALDRGMTQLCDHSQSIGVVVDLVHSVAKQTKLLALNASIEAARAGEYGRGFAVVAGEVGKLASESENATLEISRYIDAVQRETQSVSLESSRATEYFQLSLQRIEETEKAFFDLHKAVEDTTEEMGHVTTGLSSISHGLNEYNDTLKSFVANSHETKSNSHEVMVCSQQQLESINRSRDLVNHLMDLSNRLNGMSSQFEVN